MFKELRHLPRAESGSWQTWKEKELKERGTFPVAFLTAQTASVRDDALAHYDYVMWYKVATDQQPGV